MHDIHELLELGVSKQASDLLIKAGAPPAFRIDGRIVSTRMKPLERTEARELVNTIIYAASRDHLLKLGVGPQDQDQEITYHAEQLLQRLNDGEELDLDFTVPDLIRVRANVFQQRSTPGAALRIIPLYPRSIEELNLPLVLKDLARLPQGMLIVTGPTGSGKSTTLASIIEYINETRECNVVTIEDPIEYVYEDKRSIVNQRQVGSDTKSFPQALRAVLRQTPDVIMIGEMRDADTMNVCMTAAEVGHLVLSTLHTTSAAATVDRIVHSFPPHEKEHICIRLASSLAGVISQKLLPKATPPGRVPAVEVMTASPTVRKYVEEGATHELYGVIRESHHFGMNTMNESLEPLYNEGAITYEAALAAAGNLTELKQMLRRA